MLQELRSVIDREVEVSGLPISAEASVAFVVAPEDGVNVGALLRRGDLAMYGAKAHHVGVMRRERSLDHYDAASLSLVSELRHPIDDGQLVLHYQPQVSLAGSQVNSIEALVRWCHPAHGLLQPDQFLPLAEQTDVIEALTGWVLRTALSEIRALGPAYAGLSVAVNVSARSIGRASFADEVIAIVRELEVQAECLIIEVAETALLADPPSAAVVLDRLSAAGASISLDDFGRGQTSLAHLSALPIHELKIDQSFVADMLDNAAHAAIVRSVIDLGHNLLLRVVAEGVEREEVLSILRQSGCDIAQGFLLARPMPFMELDGWLREARGYTRPASRASARRSRRAARKRQARHADIGQSSCEISARRLSCSSAQAGQPSKCSRIPGTRSCGSSPASSNST